ncbi:MAG: YdcH family protein [Beijerinckiaceae bacterium]
MSIQGHLAELEKRHKALERQIEDARLHPSVDDLLLADLKRKKLRLKEEMEKLRNGKAHSASVH